LSPEDVPRAVAEAMAAGEAASPRLMTSGATGAGAAGYPRASSKDGQMLSGEAEGEICMFGMSDDEQDLPSDDEDDQLERNVVASTIQEGSGAAFATNVCFEPEDLDLGLPASDGALSPLSAASPRMLSPLIAQLNPFMSPPLFNLPPAAGAVDGMSLASCGAEQDAALTHGEPMGAAPESGAAADVRHLLAEMGDLVCKLQQKQEMAITAQEVSPDELLKRLVHFREVAHSNP